MRDPGWEKVGSGIGKTIPDPQHWLKENSGMEKEEDGWRT
jgi:hypothetical protein